MILAHFDPILARFDRFLAILTRFWQFFPETRKKDPDFGRTRKNAIFFGNHSKGQKTPFFHFPGGPPGNFTNFGQKSIFASFLRQYCLENSGFALFSWFLTIFASKRSFLTVFCSKRQFWGSNTFKQARRCQTCQKGRKSQKMRIKFLIKIRITYVLFCAFFFSTQKSFAWSPLYIYIYSRVTDIDLEVCQRFCYHLNGKSGPKWPKNHPFWPFPRQP